MDAAVLAGGRNSRMNFRDKSLLDFKGKSFLERIVSQLDSFDRVIIISNNKDNHLTSIKADYYKDLVEGIGPLGGIYSALSKSDSSHIFITSCDMPLIESEKVQLISSFNEYDIVMPVLNGKYEMLFALYSQNCLPQIEKMIKEKRYKIIGLFDDKTLSVKRIPIGEDFKATLRNINTEKDYQNLRNC